MNEIDVIFNSETSKRVYDLVKRLDHSKQLESQVWNAFCLKENENIPTKQFGNHPNVLRDNSSAESVSEKQSFIVLHKKRYFGQLRGECSSRSRSNTSSASSLSIQQDDDKSDEVLEKEKVRYLRINSKNYRRDKKRFFSVNNKTHSKVNKMNDNNEPVPKLKNINCKLKENVVPKLETAVKNVGAREHYDQKIKILIEKTVNCIEEIRYLIEKGVPQPDGTEDLARRKKRVTEFSSRFSRVYLYQISRQVNELTKLIKPQSGRNSTRQMNLHQKLVSTHQAVHQAYQAYFNHLPTSVGFGVPDKLKELINQCDKLSKIHQTILNSSPNEDSSRMQYLKVFDDNCKNLLNKMQENIESTASLLHSTTSKITLLGHKLTKQPKNVMHKKNLNARLSMYSTSARMDSYWKKAVAALVEKKKFNVQSRYKTGLFKHRPPMTKTNPDENQIKPKVVFKRSQESVRSEKIKKPMNEDKITTMVQMERDGVSVNNINANKLPNNQNESNIKNEILKPLVRGLFSQFCEENKDMSQQEFENILRSLLAVVQDSEECNKNGGEVKNNVQEMLDLKFQLDKDGKSATQISKSPEKCRSENLKNSISSKSCEKSTAGSQKMREKRKQTITVSGEKNARLICIKDDDSIQETSDGDMKENKKPQATKSKKQITSSQTQTEIPNENKSLTNIRTAIGGEVEVINERSSKTSIKISRIPKRTLRPLQILKTDEALRVIQYKLEFSKFNKGNHMYKKSNSIHPWILTGKIADQILEQLLLSIAREIEISEILDTLYQSEFQ